MEDIFKKKIEVKLLLVSGWTTSGKTTFVKIVSETFNSNFFNYQFAKSLKDDIKNEYSLTDYDLYDQTGKISKLEKFPIKITDKSAFYYLEPILELCVIDNENPIIMNKNKISDLINLNIDLNKNILGNKKYLIIDNYLYVHFDTNLIKKLFWSPRALMVFIANYRRSINPDHFILKTVLQIEKDLLNYSQSKNLIILMIDDWRYKNEEIFINNYFKNYPINLEIIKIRIDRFNKHPTGSNDNSEHDLDNYNFDFILNNKFTFKKYQKNIKKLILQILKIKN